MTGNSSEDGDWDAVDSLILAILLGLVVSGLALFIAAMFSMGYALQEPLVLALLLPSGPIFSLTVWALLNKKKANGASHHSKHHRSSPKRHPSLTRKIMLFWCGTLLSFVLFLIVLLVENQFPGEEVRDVFGPYYTHPFRLLSGIVLGLLGLATGGVLYARYQVRECAFGLWFGSVAFGLLLIFAK